MALPSSSSSSTNQLQTVLPHALNIAIGSDNFAYCKAISSQQSAKDVGSQVRPHINNITFARHSDVKRLVEQCRPGPCPVSLGAQLLVRDSPVPASQSLPPFIQGEPLQEEYRAKQRLRLDRLDTFVLISSNEFTDSVPTWSTIQDVISPSFAKGLLQPTHTVFVYSLYSAVRARTVCTCDY